jgi:hypothetical protein
LGKRWPRDLGSLISYPLIAGGKVFVTTAAGLYALDATTESFRHPSLHTKRVAFLRSTGVVSYAVLTRQWKRP